MGELSSPQPLEHNTTGRAAGRKRDARLFVLPGWLAALLVGLLVLIGVVPGTSGAGALCVLVSVGGCVWELNHWARVWRNRQRIALSAQAHAAKKANRQARQTEQNNQRQQRKEVQVKAKQAHTLRNQAEREAQIERAQQEAAQRSARFAQVTREAERLQSLNTSAFRAEAERIFAAHELNSRNESASVNTVFRFAEGSVAVADVEAIEAERQQANAARACLIGRDGFTTAAVRLSQRFPITFVEPQLLAQWKITAEEEEKKRRI